MFDLVKPSYNFALTYVQKLVADIPDDQLCAQPVPGRIMNHGAWSIGHLAWANDNVLAMLGMQKALDDRWKDQFGMGTKPLPDRAAYPSKDEILKALESGHARLLDAVQSVSSDVLAQPAPERMRSRLPTVGHVVLGLMTTHFGNHLGQLSAWRRAMGFPSVF